jgi:septum formation protein
MHLAPVTQNFTILLGSQSPRRRALIKELGFKVEIAEPAHTSELYPTELKAHEIPLYLSQHKAQALAQTVNPGQVLLTADTIVWINNTVVEKPEKHAHAVAMLQTLSGRMHQVFTGVTLLYNGRMQSFFDETRVYFRPLTHTEIEHYVQHYKPFDKAGAYGVQEWIGFVGVERIEGSYFNVMGLPVHLVYSKVLEITDCS